MPLDGREEDASIFSPTRDTSNDLYEKNSREERLTDKRKKVIESDHTIHGETHIGEIKCKTLLAEIITAGQLFGLSLAQW